MDNFEPKSQLQKVWGIGILGLLLVIVYFQAINNSTSSISVVGDAVVTTKPETVSIIVSRANIADSADVAITEGDEGVSRLIEAAKKIVGNEVEVKRSFYQITPQDNGKFVVANAFSLKTKKVGSINNLIKYLYSNGATTVSGASFEAGENNKIEDEARKKAVEDAKVKADSLAKSAGKKVKKIVSVVDDNSTMSSSVSNDNLGENALINIEKKVSVVFEVR
ncbi:MAG TPA: SIMPL domain-containing protein [Candidatus Woesebacteria bacterium]|nr:SIMPL domain-containing protein [Candidatus Woesebacteria bacterium]HPJ17284.1 SIMPL domain-containing protein [Candidatus Woesebacteria bacterium]